MIINTEFLKAIYSNFSVWKSTLSHFLLSSAIRKPKTEHKVYFTLVYYYTQMGCVFGKERGIQFCVSEAPMNSKKLMRKNYNKNAQEMHSCTEKNTKKAVKCQVILHL